MAVGTSFFRARFTSFRTHASLTSSVFLPYFILAVPMREYCGAEFHISYCRTSFIREVK